MRGSAILAVFTLALGIGAAVAVFSIVDAVLLRPLPYRDPASLAAVWLTSTREGTLSKMFAAHRDYEEIRRLSQSFESISAATWAKSTGRTLTGRGPARDILTIPATASFFSTLGANAAIGRAFQPGDETQGCSLVLAHSFWSSTFASDPAIIGKSLSFQTQTCTVLGVMPPTFGFYPRQTQAWILLGPNFTPGQNDMLVGIFGRLRPGVTTAQAEAELIGIYRALHKEIETRDFQPIVRDLHSEFTTLAGPNLRSTLLLVFASVLLVLLIACLNVANLLLARLSGRQRELAVRATLGASQFRLGAQVLGEGFLLAAWGTALGIGLAAAAIRIFRAISPIELGVQHDIRISLPVLAFSVVLAFATTLFFAGLPAIRAGRVDLVHHLKAAGRGLVHGRQGLARAVIAIEMSLSFVLLIGAVLLLSNALHMRLEPLGYDPDGILATRIGARDDIYQRLLERIPGAALASKLPPNVGGNQTLERQDKPVVKGAEIHDTGGDAVSPEFFNLLRIPLRAGRVFTDADTAASRQVAVINESLAAKYFPDGDPIGRRIRIGGGNMQWLTIVGIVGNTKHTEFMNETRWVETPILYRPMSQEPRPAMQLAVRGYSAQHIQAEIAAADSAIPIGEIEPLTVQLGQKLAYPRFRAVILGFFALSALLLSAVGLYGVVSQLVARRIPEFGVRKAIGAQTGHLLWLVFRQGGAPVVLGLAAGAAFVLASNRLLANLLYGMTPSDPEALTAVSAILLLVALLAMLAPAIRAARIDPLTALRDE
ncbi:MAG: ABC transporter permease [Acidobacteria bacterium]|nr:ABC transporter permease [Acidobacteriota bacterium]